MFRETAIINEYFDWLCNIVCKNRFHKANSYRKLLQRLHETDFIYYIRNDENRACDGIGMRYRFAVENYRHDKNEIEDILAGPCSVLEMMIALAVRCEENLTDNPDIGDRTGQWFWVMIASLGLNGMTDEHFDIDYVDEVMVRLLERKYEPDGKGGLFTVRNCDEDMRKIEIWAQLLRYLDKFILGR